MAVRVVLQVGHALKYVVELENTTKVTCTTLPEELDQRKHKMSKCVKVAAIQQDILEPLRKARFQVAAQEDPLAIAAHTPDERGAGRVQEVSGDRARGGAWGRSRAREVA